MQKVDLAELRRLHEAATTGKWFAFRLSVASASLLVGDIVCQPPDEDCEESLKQWPHNADYISAVRNALPALLDELEALREEVAELNQGIASANSASQSYYEKILWYQSQVPERDRRMKAIGAAEKLEQLAGKFGGQFVGTRRYNTDELLEIAAQLRREAGE